MTATAREPDDEGFVPDPSGSTACRLEQNPTPNTESRNGDCGVGPNLIGVRSDLFEHVEIVLMARLPHALEDADIPARNVRHAQAEHRCKSIGTHQRGVPRMSCTPVMAHEDSAGDIQRIEQANEVAGRLQRRVQGCVRRS